jgi:hypothetical protein
MYIRRRLSFHLKLEYLFSIKFPFKISVDALPPFYCRISKGKFIINKLNQYHFFLLSVRRAIQPAHFPFLSRIYQNSTGIGYGIPLIPVFTFLFYLCVWVMLFVILEYIYLLTGKRKRWKIIWL